MGDGGGSDKIDVDLIENPFWPGRSSGVMLWTCFGRDVQRASVNGVGIGDCIGKLYMAVWSLCASAQQRLISRGWRIEFGDCQGLSSQINVSLEMVSWWRSEGM